MSRPSFAVLILGLALAVAGCAAAPEPEPTPSGFASEEELFAAAEETLEGYIEALDAADYQDPEALEPVYAWLTGEALATSREDLTELAASGYTKSGTSVITLVQPAELAPAEADASVDACIDVSRVDIVDASGASVVAEDRPDVQSVRVAFTGTDATRTGLAIEQISGREGEPSCEDD